MLNEKNIRIIYYSIFILMVFLGIYIYTIDYGHGFAQGFGLTMSISSLISIILFALGILKFRKN